MHPALAMLDGCGGAYSKSGQPKARHSMWGACLAPQGYVVLASLSSRGIQEIRTVRFKQRTLKEADRVSDAYAALNYVRQLPAADPQCVTLPGWSHGVGVTLEVITSSNACARKYPTSSQIL